MIYAPFSFPSVKDIAPLHRGLLPFNTRTLNMIHMITTSVTPSNQALGNFLQSSINIPATHNIIGQELPNSLVELHDGDEERRH